MPNYCLCDRCGCGGAEGLFLCSACRRKRLKNFWHEQAEWSQKTFGTDQERGPEGPLKHLAKEVEECLKNTKDLVEYCDLLFLVFDSTRRAGFTYDQLVTAAFDKLEINKSRKWGKASATEAVEHIRE